VIGFAGSHHGRSLLDATVTTDEVVDCRFQFEVSEVVFQLLGEAHRLPSQTAVELAAGQVRPFDECDIYVPAYRRFV